MTHQGINISRTGAGEIILFLISVNKNLQTLNVVHQILCVGIIAQLKNNYFL